MRYIEIITESEQSKLERDILDLLIATKASGIDELDTETLVKQLNDMGHAITIDSLLSIYSEERPSIIQNITASTVTLDVADTTIDVEDVEKDLERDTSKQAMKNIKARAAQTKKLGKELR